jgi:hypothetical protein
MTEDQLVSSEDCTVCRRWPAKLREALCFTRVPETGICEDCLMSRWRNGTGELARRDE